MEKQEVIDECVGLIKIAKKANSEVKNEESKLTINNVLCNLEILVKSLQDN